MKAYRIDFPVAVAGEYCLRVDKGAMRSLKDAKRRDRNAILSDDWPEGSRLTICISYA